MYLFVYRNLDNGPETKLKNKQTKQTNKKPPTKQNKTIKNYSTKAQNAALQNV